MIHSMFHYSQYRSTSRCQIRTFVDHFPLAVITSCLDGRWQSSHIPLFWSDDRDDELFGHSDVANGQFSVGSDLHVYVVFAGPNAYIPPEAYTSRQLPTWNYLSVHASGTISIDSDRDRNIAILKRTADCLRRRSGEFSVTDGDLRIGQWIGSVLGLRFRISEIEGRFKLSQDKATEDVRAAARHFVQSSRECLSPDLVTSLLDVQPAPYQDNEQ